MEVLVDKKIILTKEHVNQDYKILFTLMKDYEEISIEIKYGKKVVEENKILEKQLESCYTKYRLGTKVSPREIPSSLLNFVTFSLDYETTYLGCAHKHTCKSIYKISEILSSPGFSTFRPKAGNYCVSLHPFAIMTEVLEYEICIRAYDKLSLSYVPLEMHTHTIHSDGDFLPLELAEAVKAYGYDGFAMTDHNTREACKELNRAFLQEKNLFFMPGMECTTYFGHLLVLGVDVDWRIPEKDNMEPFLDDIVERGGVCGIAHPFEFGAPISCGSHWEFDIKDWSNISYIELWSTNDPYSKSKNLLVRPWYDSLLLSGNKLAITAGRDWHRPDVSIPEKLTATYVGIQEKELSESAIKKALREGRTYVSMGMEIEVFFYQNNTRYSIGDTMKHGTVFYQIRIQKVSSAKAWGRNGVKAKTVDIVHNGSKIVSRKVEEKNYEQIVFTGEISVMEGFVRVEIVEEYPIVITSPIYVK